MAMLYAQYQRNLDDELHTYLYTKYEQTFWFYSLYRFNGYTIQTNDNNESFNSLQKL